MAGPGTCTRTARTARSTVVIATAPPEVVPFLDSKAMPVRWSPTEAPMGTLTVKPTTVWPCGGTVRDDTLGLTQAPALLVGVVRAEYTAPVRTEVMPSTAST